MTVLIRILQVVLALSVLVFFHELGHYLFARLFKIRVDKFYLFFDFGGHKLFSTHESRLVRTFFPRLAASHTDFGMGGYCKIAGMVDESLDMQGLAAEPQPWEFRSKPVWQRFLVMAGGVLFNFILAALVFAGLLCGWGRSYISNEDAQVYVNSLAYDMGFRTGDRILDFDGYVEKDFSQLQADLARRRVSCVQVLRGGDTLSLYMDERRIGEVLASPGMFDLAVPFVVDTVPPSSPNAALLHRGDHIVALDGVEVPFLQDSRVLLSALPDSSVTATVYRDGEVMDLPLQVDSLGHIGVYSVLPGLKTRTYGFWEAIPSGFAMTFTSIADYVRDLRLVFTPSTQAYKSVGSFIAMGQAFPAAWDWYRFLSILALFSVMLGVMNLLPIPGLDGGHMLFALYEMITGRKPGDRFLYVTQLIGMLLLVLLMLLAFGNDISRLFH